MVACACNPSSDKNGDLEVSGAHGPASSDYLANSRPERDHLKNQNTIQWAKVLATQT